MNLLLGDWYNKNMNVFNLEQLNTVGQVPPNNSIINADCLEAMKFIPDKSIAAIICDLPYGITACKWDTVIPFEPLWEQYKRIIKHNGAICLFGSQPFTSMLVMSNPKWFKYCWYWVKNRQVGFAHSKNRPMMKVEDIAVFSPASMGHASILGEKRMTYNPQGIKPVGEKVVSSTWHGNITGKRPNQSGKRYEAFTGFPNNLLYFDNILGSGTIHPTQKPVALIEYLIETYTQEGDLILDNTAGSGTLAIAAINTKRNYICIEKDEHYFEVMRNRIENRDPNAVKPKQPKKKKLTSNEDVQLSLF